MPSDFEPTSTTTWVAVSLTTVPLMTWSSPTDSSVSVVKFSSAAAKSSLAAGAQRLRVRKRELESRGGRKIGASVRGGSLRSAGVVVRVSGASTTADPPVCVSCADVMVSSGGVRVVGGAVVVQSHNLLRHARGCATNAGRSVADCWRGLQVALRPPWRTTLGQSQLPERRSNPRPMGTLRL